MKQNIKRFVVLALAVIFIAVGLVSLVLPLLPGWLFFIIGFLLLSLYFPSLRSWMDEHTVRWPKVHAMVRRIRLWADQNIGKL